MTIQSRRFLKKLRKAQITEDRQIFIDFNEMTAITVHNSSQEHSTVDIKKYRHSARSILRYLKDLGYIDYNTQGSVKVLHAGWKIIQTDISKFFKFLSTSVLIPIGVSVATTIVLYLLEKFIR